MTVQETEAQQDSIKLGLPWRLQDIDFSKLQAERVRGDDTLFFFLVTSSFVEAASDLYTRNLCAYYAGDHEVEEWLQHHWEPEELQHGRALRAYVQVVWPEFDWETANADFFGEYSAICTLEAFEPTRGLEMAARCVVETGTSSTYRAIHDYTNEPVLKALTRHLKSDEVRHFGYFLHFFQRYREVESVSRLQVARAIIQRIAEARSEDILVAFKHAFRVRFPQVPFADRHYQEYKQNLKRIMKRNFPFEMAVKMLLKPVDPPRSVRSPLHRLLVHGARGFLFG